MQKYVCGACGYIYDPALGDPDSGIAPGTAFEDIPEDWVCPNRAHPVIELLRARNIADIHIRYQK